jgi:hypothetical protein
MIEVKDILHYVHILQLSIKYYSHVHLIPSDGIVHQGLRPGGTKLLPLSHSMIGEVIVSSSFTSTSLERESAITDFITSEDSILFDVLLHPGHSAGYDSDHSKFISESETLIAA